MSSIRSTARMVRTSQSFCLPLTITGHAYSPDSRYLAVIERHNSKDFVGIYDTSAQYGLLRVCCMSALIDRLRIADYYPALCAFHD
jgi:hypothetical protein